MFSVQIVHYAMQGCSVRDLVRDVIPIPRSAIPFRETVTEPSSPRVLLDEVACAVGDLLAGVLVDVLAGLLGAHGKSYPERPVSIIRFCL